jgi:superoxide dismutase, Fe-Mn family
MPSRLRSELEESFASIENFKVTFLANAQAMFGGGFVWLVRVKATPGSDNQARFRILRTYNAGSPLAGAHWRTQAQEVSLGEQSKQVAERIAKDAVVLVEPVLCVSVWEHSYIVDWKVRGKRQFLDAWWARVNWNVVEELALGNVAPEQRPTRAGRDFGRMGQDAPLWGVSGGVVQKMLTT